MTYPDDLPDPSTNTSNSNQSNKFVFSTVAFFDVKRAIRFVKSNAVGLTTPKKMFTCENKKYYLSQHITIKQPMLYHNKDF
jgi:negative regulator of genetic competence, sporulation and motility